MGLAAVPGPAELVNMYMVSLAANPAVLAGIRMLLDVLLRSLFCSRSRGIVARCVRGSAGIKRAACIVNEDRVVAGHDKIRVGNGDG